MLVVAQCSRPSFFLMLYFVVIKKKKKETKKDFFQQEVPIHAGQIYVSAPPLLLFCFDAFQCRFTCSFWRLINKKHIFLENGYFLKKSTDYYVWKSILMLNSEPTWTGCFRLGEQMLFLYYKMCLQMIQWMVLGSEYSALLLRPTGRLKRSLPWERD